MQVCAMSPMTISLWMPCFLSYKSKSVLAKPLEHQCSCATIPPGAGTNSARNSPPHVPYSKLLCCHAPRWTGATYLHARGIQDLQHVGNAVVRFSDSFDQGPELAALGNEVVVGIDH